ncbi:MAG: ligase-associated DNA damage response endonuclease PdeM [Alphaproteobacteria bacterium]|nr:ligase-associated DNA damage response endonuclease PdeM [Alphaproteobacteria bacterium]
MPSSPRPQASLPTRPCGLSRSARIALAGLELVPDLSGALLIPDFATLVVADLHLEKGSSLARRGLHIPPYDTRATLRLLAEAIEASGARHLICLGDSFHDGEARARIDGADLASLRAITATVETTWISGNHDPAPATDLGGRIAEYVALGPLTLRHAPAALEEGEREIAGHFHPAASIMRQGRSIRCRCFIGDDRRLIMPAFGSYTGSLDVSAPAIAALFDSAHVWMIGRERIHRFPSSLIR